jgi:hypothetical protein
VRLAGSEKEIPLSLASQQPIVIKHASWGWGEVTRRKGVFFCLGRPHSQSVCGSMPGGQCTHPEQYKHKTPIHLFSTGRWPAAQKHAEVTFATCQVCPREGAFIFRLPLQCNYRTFCRTLSPECIKTPARYAATVHIRNTSCIIRLFCLMVLNMYTKID